MTRSEIISRIRSRGNASTELALARVFRRHGMTGWRRQRRILGISVDFAFRKSRIAVFTDGCFWHGCETHCNIGRLQRFWQEKINGNMTRDYMQTMKLMNAGWKVIRVWEHSLKEAV